ncbi:spindle and kinetochore-associated protein 1 isoform X1 [Lepisosteus oculatus]|uniref:SKA complex subunit 1 n=2 Tax=Lepisosteus oculatus TaxID=7918 RepID=W5N5A0_LEPOC|nr:PREDICTED: spindle and kinetochore-associated protein 1 isoform X1 [Lepisosteus oculatus]
MREKFEMWTRSGAEGSAGAVTVRVQTKQQQAALTMDSCDLGELTQHINNKISCIRKMIELRTVVNDPHKRSILQKVAQDVLTINMLLDQFEKHLAQQKEMLKTLKEVEESFKEDVKEAEHLSQNIPPHMPRKTSVTASVTEVKSEKDPDTRPVPEQEPVRKPSKCVIKEMEFVTLAEFESIPQYMKGRMTYDQLNGVIEEINKAVTSKYKILHQPLKSMSNASRKLYQRFKDEETKGTKGLFFIVDTDIREFTSMNVGKRFMSMLNVLRHCQRLRELRGGGVTRYVLL